MSSAASVDWGLAKSTFSFRTSGVSRIANVEKASAVLVNCFWMASLCFLDIRVLELVSPKLSSPAQAARATHLFSSPHLAHVDGLKTDFRSGRAGLQREVAVLGIGKQRVRHPRVHVLPVLLPIRQG